MTCETCRAGDRRALHYTERCRPGYLECVACGRILYAVREVDPPPIEPTPPRPSRRYAPIRWLAHTRGTCVVCRADNRTGLHHDERCYERDERRASDRFHDLTDCATGVEPPGCLGLVPERLVDDDHPGTVRCEDDDEIADAYFSQPERVALNGYKAATYRGRRVRQGGGDRRL